MSYFEKSLEILSSVFREGAFVNIELNSIDEKDRALVTRIVYGTVEKFYELDFILRFLAPKAPKSEVRIILMQAIYAMRYMNIPHYAVVNENVEITKKTYRQLKGFVNAVLMKVSRNEYSLPGIRDEKYYEVKYNLPQWLIEKVKNEYPSQFDEILSAEAYPFLHVRLSKSFSEKEFLDIYKGESLKTETGYYAKNTEEMKRLFREGKVTFQSKTSTLAVEAMGNIKGKTLLDTCAAPGGKSVFASEKGAKVTALELYPHRAELIRKYSSRMRAPVEVFKEDASVFNPLRKDLYDIVLIDAPCSGLGVLGKRRDIVFNRTDADISRLARLQYKILLNCSKYVKPQGELIYSTCTIFKEENGSVIDRFLLNNSNFKKEIIPIFNSSEMQFLPDGKGTDGFYIAKLRRVK